MQPLEPTENKSKSSKSAKPRHFLHSRTMALIVACLAILPILIGAYLIYVVARYQASPSNLSDQFGSTTFDLNNLSPAKPTAATGLVVINGNEQVNGNLTVAGSVTANTYNGSGANLTNINANNITSGTLNDARLSPNVVLLGSSPNFVNITITGTTTINGQTYSWPDNPGAAGRVLGTDGAGNLSWVVGGGGGCATQCINNGGDSFGSGISIGSNDAFPVSIRVGGTDWLTITVGGTATFNSGVVATSFSGDGSALTNVDAATLNGQAGSFYQNASNLNAGTLNDARLSANVALLNAANVFSAGNTFSSGITTNSITTTAGLTVGNPGQSLTLQGNGSTSLSSTAGGFTTTIGFSGVPTGNVNYQLDASVAGTYGICTIQAGVSNCGGLGQVTTLGGTSGRLALFTGAQTIGNSTITDNGTTVTFPLTTLFQPSSDSTTAFQIQNSAGTSNTFVVDTTNSRIGINRTSNGFAVDVSGDVNVDNVFSTLRINGVAICGTLGCSAQSGSGSYIQNDVALQTNTNFYIEDASVSSVGGIIKGKPGQTADLFRLQDGTGANVVRFDAPGNAILTGTITSGLINGQTISSSANFTGTVNIAGASALSLGTANTNTGSIIFKGSGGANTITLNGATTPGGNRTITLADETGTVCLQNSASCGFVLTSANAFVQGGNTFGAPAVLGTNDGNSLSFRTNSTNYFTLDTSGLSTITEALATNGALATKVTGDSNNRYQLLANGTMQWGPGNAAADTFMLRDSAAGTLAVQPSASATPAQGLVKVYATGSTGSILNLRVSGGTIASPTATPTGTNGIGTMAFHGYTGAAYSAGTSGLVGYQTQTWTGSAQGADIFFYVTANNTTSTSFKRQPPAKISSAGLSIGAVGAAGNNEKLKVNPHTTIDNNAVVILNPSATTVKGAVVQAVGGQSVNIQGWQDSNGVAMSAIDSTGQLVLGNTSGQAGSVTFVNGSGSTNTALATATLSASRIITLPNETGTVCLQSSSSCGFAIGSGTAFLQGGNSFGTIASLGTIDTTTSSCIGTCGQPLSIKTANTTYITTQSDVLNTTFNCTNSAAQLCQLVGQNGATISIKGAGTNSEHFGASSASAGNSGLAFGNSASAGFASSIAIGFGASTTAANQLVVGDSTNGSTTNAITSVFIGAGVTNSSPGLGINYSATGGGGSNVAGASLTWAGGISTGTAAGGSIVFQTSPASGVSSSTANTLTTYFTLNSAGVLTGSNSATISVPGTNATNENWGSGASASSSNTLAVGNGASVASGGLSDRTTAIGRLATGVANAQNIVLFGYNAVDTGAADNNVIFGANAKTTGSNSVVFGPSTNASAGSVIIGQGSTSTNTNVIVFGGGQSGVASTTMLIGTVNNSITSVYIGKGITNGTPVAVAINGTGGSGTDIAGAAISIAGGRGTGSAIGGAINFQTSAAGASGSTLRSLSTVASFAGGTGYATFQNTANTSSSFTAFQVLSAGGQQLFGVDTGANTNVAKFTGSNGTNQCTVAVGTGWSCSSDERLKTNIVSLDTLGSLEKVGALRPVTYNWTAEASGDRSLQYGFIAQDVEQIYPEAVSTDPTTGYKMINQGRLLTFTIMGLKDAAGKINALNTAINTSNPSALTITQPATISKGLTVTGPTTVTDPTTLSGNVQFSGGAEFEGVVKSTGRIELSKNNTGSTTVPAGQTTTRVAFMSNFASAPNIALTPHDFLNTKYRVTNVTNAGFEIELSSAEQTNKLFDWRAL